MARMELLGLESDMASQLSRVLRNNGHDVHAGESIESALGAQDIDILFADGDGPDYQYTLRRLRMERPDLRVVLVNRLPENTRWLDALEMGAADYCGAPFEAVQMRWLVE